MKLFPYITLIAAVKALGFGARRKTIQDIAILTGGMGGMM